MITYATNRGVLRLKATRRADIVYPPPALDCVTSGDVEGDQEMGAAKDWVFQRAVGREQGGGSGYGKRARHVDNVAGFCNVEYGNCNSFLVTHYKRDDRHYKSSLESLQTFIPHSQDASPPTLPSSPT